jgi:hypothetical protein
LARGVFYDNLIFVGDLSGHIYKIDISKGEIKGKISTEYLLNIPFTNLGDKIVIPTAEGKILLMKKENFETIQTIQMEGRIRTEAIELQGKVIFGYDYGEIAVFEPIF